MDPRDVLDYFEFEDHLFLQEGDDHEVVAKYYSPLEGEVAAARLRSEGVPCFLANAVSQSILPHLQLVARLHVRPGDVEKAREILGEAAIDAGENPTTTKVNYPYLFLLALAIVVGLVLAHIFVRALPK
jgi:Putative prokaryotic signal transducing protein